MRIVLMDFVNMNTQIYKTIGSLSFYKYEQAPTICFKCTCVTEYNPYVFFSRTMNNNNLPHVANSSELTEKCITIDGFS